MQIIVCSDKMANDHGKRFKLLTPPLCWKCPKRFKLGLGEPWESESDADFDETVLVNKSSPAQSPSVLVKNCVSESHEGPQELQLDNESVSDELLILASQKYEDDRGCYLEENDETDEILLLASQQFEEQYSSDGEVSRDSNLRYGSPKSSKQVSDARRLGVPQKTQGQNKWVAKVWCDWVQHRLQMPCIEKEEQQYPLMEDFCKMSIKAMNFWLAKFVLEVRRKDGKPYCPETLYQICCGLVRLLKEADRAEVDKLANPMFVCFRASLDAWMKELKSTGKYQVKKAEVITEEQENCLWEKGLLGDKNPQQLLDTLIFYIGFCFALRSGMEHRRLRFYPSQIQLFEPTNGRNYVMYTEDVSKTNQGGLVHRKKEPKQVVQYANDIHPERCLVRLYKMYVSKCPVDRPDGAFYLKPLAKPTQTCWYQKTPVGHNTLQKTVSRLCDSAGFDGHFTNHSLRATSATRLFEAKVDEQLIMQRTGHASSAMRAYKRVGEKLRAVTSDVLNGCVNINDETEEGDEVEGEKRGKPVKEKLQPGVSIIDIEDETKEGNEVQEQKQGKPVKEKLLPGISFIGVSNCTININYDQRKE